MADHIQLHQGWMRNFQNNQGDGKQVYCLNVGCGSISDGKRTIEPYEIGSIKIKSLGAVANYYIKDFERYLDKHWESRFGSLYKDILTKFKSNNSVINLTNDQINFLKRFMAVNMGRSTFLKNEYIKTTSCSYELFGINEILPASTAASNLQLFENAILQFLSNQTSIGFVMPSISYYYVMSAYIETTPIIPLSDKLAIRFIKKTNTDIDATLGGLIIDINDKETIKSYNYYAMLTEINTNKQFIIAKHMNELECLLRGE
ncbi:MAG: hypothetical protein IJF66_06840 [Clostridia bacterium]|nr:hypothetical protein [Clostridia bacterium]